MKQYTIKEIREKKLKISQEELAHRMGKTVACWNRKENYLRSLKASELLDLCKIAKLDPRQVKLTK